MMKGALNFDQDSSCELIAKFIDLAKDLSYLDVSFQTSTVRKVKVYMQRAIEDTLVKGEISQMGAIQVTHSETKEVIYSMPTDRLT